MAKKCILCGKPAKYSIKDTSDFYCEECAKEQFSDLKLLVNVEETAKKIKRMIHEKIEEDEGESVEESVEEQEDTETSDSKL